MAITKLNSLAIPDDTIVEADLSYPLTNFSSTGIDDNASGTKLTVDSTGISVSGAVQGDSLVAYTGLLELDDNGTHNGQINAPASLFINIDSDNTNTGEAFVIAKDRSTLSGGTELIRVTESGLMGIGTTSPGRTLDVNGVIRADGTSGALAFGGNSSTPSEGVAIHRPASDTMAFCTNTKATQSLGPKFM